MKAPAISGSDAREVTPTIMLSTPISRSFLPASIPSMTGISRSMKMTSKDAPLTHKSTASIPLTANSASASASVFFSSILQTRRTIGSSSTMSTESFPFFSVPSKAESIIIISLPPLTQK
ncbi:hypothetical protein MLD38_017904 [Melastoma candidum]|uniref:Uncharacterized protein n=1 Tax=Melastoma candidum TaxID=119954 RepID=A0ACB9QTG2_9MYRT|nr:hypothetical protein MLD38_017904 [Melastoma candidum]